MKPLPYQSFVGIKTPSLAALLRLLAPLFLSVPLLFSVPLLISVPLLTSSPVKERPSSGIPSPAVRPQASPAALYSPLWLASSFYGLSKLSPLLGQHPFLLLQVLYITVYGAFLTTFYAFFTV